MYRIDLDQLLVWFIDMPLLAEACSQSLDGLFCITCFCLTDKHSLVKIRNLFRFPRELPEAIGYCLLPGFDSWLMQD